jgi:hypothetical protein
MLKLLRCLGGGEDPPSPVEHFGNARISRALGLEIIQATAHRRNCILGIRDCLSSMTRVEKDDLIDRIFARLALLVFDLPSSPSNPSSDRFGLLDHLFEVAGHTARELTGPEFQVSPEVSVHHREGPLWAYAGVIAAIAHDLGKALDLDLVLPGTAAPWDPRREPLRLFCQRTGISGTSPALWQVHEGLGRSAHERHIRDLLPLVITPEVGRYLGPRLSSLLHELSPDQSGPPRSDLTRTAREVVGVVRRIDRALWVGGQEAGPPKAERFEALPPSCFFRGVGSQPRRDPAPGALRPGGPGGPPGGGLPPIRVPGYVCPVPPDFLPARIPTPRDRRGDPAETALRMTHELVPFRFLDRIRRMIAANRLARNGLHSPVYLRPDFLWLMVPEAFETLARLIGIPFDTESLDRMGASLGASPWVVSGGSGTVTEFVKTRPDAPSLLAIRLKTPDFLGEPEARAPGFCDSEIRVWSPPGEWEVPR